MNYTFDGIPDHAIPRARVRLMQHALDTYASETNKVGSVWSRFGDDDLAYRPQAGASTVGDILRHQLLSERRFFGEFLGLPEIPAASVLPSPLTPEDGDRKTSRVGRAASRVPRIAPASVVARRSRLLRRAPIANLGLLASRASHRASPHAAHGVSANARPTRPRNVRADRRREMGRRRPHDVGRSRVSPIAR